MNVFEKYESEVRSYCRSFPAVFDRAKGACLFDREGRRYLDFFAGAGALNYGHNPDELQHALIDYIQRDGITHSLDLYSAAKERFIERFQQVILAPRKMAYKIQFTGPTGTNAVEAALKLARKITGRTRVLGFTHGFHGMTLGALAVTANKFKREGAGIPLQGGVVAPFDGYLGEGVDTIDYLERMFSDDGSGLPLPAAVIVETVQAEGGVNVAHMAWLKRLREVTAAHDVLLVIDDIQAGCGRTGPFFSFEPAEIAPDMITLSKSISGYGMPLSVVLLKPEHDQWAPGEHNGTFRGNNPAFVTGAAALRFWETDALQRSVLAKGEVVRGRLEELVDAKHLSAEVRGRGLIWGLDLGTPGLAKQISAACFKRGLVIETAGMEDQVLKLLPPLTVTEAELDEGLGIIAEALSATLVQTVKAAKSAA